MTLLTKTSRLAIKKSLLRHRFSAALDARAAENRAVFTETAYAMFDHLYPGKRELLALVPSGWLNWVDFLYPRYEGSGYARLPATGRHEALSDHWHLASPLPDTRYGIHMPRHVSSSAILADVHPIRAVITDAIAGTQQLAADIDAAAEKILGTLWAFKTVEKLIEAWPEVEPFIPVQERAEAVALPATIPSNLNDLLDLPSKE